MKITAIIFICLFVAAGFVFGFFLINRFSRMMEDLHSNKNRLTEEKKTWVIWAKGKNSSKVAAEVEEIRGEDGQTSSVVFFQQDLDPDEPPAAPADPNP